MQCVVLTNDYQVTEILKWRILQIRPFFIVLSCIVVVYRFFETIIIKLNTEVFSVRWFYFSERYIESFGTISNTINSFSAESHPRNIHVDIRQPAHEITQTNNVTTPPMIIAAQDEQYRATPCAYCIGYGSYFIGERGPSWMSSHHLCLSCWALLCMHLCLWWVVYAAKNKGG